MKIHLSDSELKDAIKFHLSTQENIDLNPELYNIDIQLTAGRGEKGHYADIVRRKKESVSSEPTSDTIQLNEEDTGIDFG